MRSIENVPRSVRILQHHVDFFLEILNDGTTTPKWTSSLSSSSLMMEQPPQAWKRSVFRKHAPEQVIAVPAT
jgi:hypothetical protein